MDNNLRHHILEILVKQATGCKNPNFRNPLRSIHFSWAGRENAQPHGQEVATPYFRVLKSAIAYAPILLTVTAPRGSGGLAFEILLRNVSMIL